MSVPGQLQHNLERSVVGRLQFHKHPGTYFPQLTTSIVTIEDVLQLHFSLRVSRLADGVVLVNVLSCLDPDVHLVAIHSVGDEVAYVLSLTKGRRKKKRV